MLMETKKLLTPVVLAGGKSSRMGTDKSFVCLNKKRLIEIIIETIEQKFPREEIILVTNTPDAYRYLQIRLVEDIVKNRGPLGGLHAALTYSTTPYLFLVGCDMPFLNIGLLDYMLEMRGDKEVIIPRIDGWAEPLHAIYAQECLGKIPKYLTEEKPRLDIFFPEVKVKYIEKDEIMVFDPLLKSFRNINTRADLLEAEDFLAKRN